MLLSQIEGFESIESLPAELQASLREAAEHVVVWRSDPTPETWSADYRRQARANAVSLLLREWSAEMESLESLMRAIDATIDAECSNPENCKQAVRKILAR